MSSVCFSGHRNIPAANAAAIAQSLRYHVERLVKLGYTDFYAGGAIGFDMLAAYIVLETRGARLHLLLPAKGYTKSWPSEEISFLKSLADAADSVTYVSEEFNRSCYHARNRELVRHGDILICYLTEQKGGTFYTRGLAEKKGIEIIDIAKEVIHLTEGK